MGIRWLRPILSSQVLEQGKRAQAFPGRPEESNRPFHSRAGRQGAISDQVTKAERVSPWGFAGKPKQEN